MNNALFQVITYNEKMQYAKTPYSLKARIMLLLMTALFLLSCAAPATMPVRVNDEAAKEEAKKQRLIALQVWFENYKRLADVSYTVLTGAVELCENTTYSLGMEATTYYEFERDLQEAAFALFRVAGQVRVIHVTGGSPAEKAGLQVGDIILGINNMTITTGEHAADIYNAALDVLAKVNAPVALRILRQGGARLTVFVNPEPACNYKVYLLNDIQANAFADGNNIVFTSGMLNFTKNDNELALVVSHELAHNAMGHIDAKKINYMLGSIFDMVSVASGINTGGTFGRLASRSYSQAFESEADYVGLYIMARSGLAIEDAPHFWRRMAALNPSSIENSHTSTHPSTPHRFLVLEKTVREIQEKISAGAALMPELKSSVPDDSERMFTD